MRPTTSPTRARPARRPRLGVEPLEDRSVPAVAGPAVPAADLARQARLDAAAGPLARAGYDLAYLLREYQAAVDPAAPFRPANPLLQTRDGTVVVDVLTADPAAARRELAPLGFQPVAAAATVVSGFLPITSLAAAAAAPAVRSLLPAYRALTSEGPATSQGARAVRADEVNRFLRLDGSGVTVGVLSDSYNALGGAPGDVAAGELPGPGNPLGRTTPVNVLADADGRDEGRAMLQVVHDVAPGAGLAFAPAGVSQTQFAANIRALARAGADVIVDDVEFPAAPMFQDGVAARAVDEVAGLGVAYFSAAGNRGRAGYEAAFNESDFDLGADGTGQVPGSPHFHAHDFDPGPGIDLLQTVTLPAGDTTISFQWADPYFSAGGGSGARTDLDLAVFDMAGNLLATVGGYSRNEGGDPVEVFTIPNDTGGPLRVQLAIGRVSGPIPVRLKYVAFRSEFQTDEYAGPTGTVYGHANAAGAIAVGAAAYDQSPAFGRPAAAQAFSSAGGTAVLFDADGAPITPEARPGPAVIAPDGVDTSFFGAADPVGHGGYEANGRPNFFGTSAAAPHAAGVAALMLQANRGLTAAQVRAALQATAADAGAPGHDDATGAGLVQAAAAVYAVGGPYTVYLGGTDGDDALRVRYSAAGVELLDGGAVVFAAPRAEVYAVDITGGAGNDALTVDTAGGPDLEGGFRFDGGAGVDTATLRGTAGDDAFTYAATGAAAGRLDWSGGGFVAALVMTAVEAAVADGLMNGTDSLRADVDAAAVGLDRLYGTGTVTPAGRLPLLYRDIERPTVAGTAVAVPGTAGADEVGVTSAGLVTFAGGNGYLNAITVAARTLTLATGGGGDRVTVAGNHPFAGGVDVDGGPAAGLPYPLGGDALVFNGAGGAVTLDPLGGSVGEAGAGAVRYANVETFLPNVGAGNTVLRAGAGGVVVTPLSPVAALVVSAAGTMTLTAPDGTLRVAGGPGGTDAVTVRLPDAAAGAAVTAGGVVQVAGFVSVAVAAGVDLLAVVGNDRDNTFAVAPGPVAVEIDGGGGNDRLAVPGTYPDRPRAGSGVVPSDPPVAYRNLEGVALGQTPRPADDTVTTAEDTPVTVDVLGNDAGLADGVARVVITSLPRFGTVVVAGGRVVYTPARDHNDGVAGADTFAYRVEDPNGDAGEARVTVRVSPVNDPPAAVGGSAEVQEDGSVVITLTGTDGDPEVAEALRFAVLANPAHGTLSEFDPVTGRVRYTPFADYSGADAFEFGVSDGGGSAAGGRVSIVVRPVADPPPVDGEVRAGGVIVTGAGPGGGPHVQVFDSATRELRHSFYAYDPAYTGGVRVATGDVDGDGVPDVITGTGPGGSAHVRVFSGVDLTVLANFYAYDPRFLGGVSLATGDLDGDGRAEVVVGAGPGAGPHVQAFRIAGGQAEHLAGPLGSFYAFDPAFQGGANVAAGDLDGDGRDEVVAGAAAGGGPHVRVFDPRSGEVRLNFFAFPDGGRLGVSVAAADLDGDGRAEVVAGAGAGGEAVVRSFSGGTAELLREIPAFAPDFRGGVWLGTVEREDGTAEVLVAPGRDARAVQFFEGSTLDLSADLEVYGRSVPGGVFVAGSPGGVRRTSQPDRR